MVATITFTHVFGSTPASQVSCAVMTPIGLIDCYLQGADTELASAGDGVSFSCVIPYTSPATVDTPYKAYWLPGKIEQTFPTQATVQQSNPPQPLPTGVYMGPAIPGILKPGLGEPGVTVQVAGGTPPSPTPPSTTTTDSAQPGILQPGEAKPGAK